ncbi:PilC family type IV fimbrial assembly protein [Trabulsiella guamensis ATCC 49490]|uniref:PilC family type IV fimbrial assembly protein n=1 Tax=Trabulsiella guamensis ATCC 49490 TaxID=1005994 RepID=A0A085ABT0_9ENTR|nr:protein transport protein HofC [Trabulsiella guamensis]KFC07675.1 PilC family type IV fimbrial assembly protein [Trabulsiella guamensis ATCC 49490]
MQNNPLWRWRGLNTDGESASGTLWAAHRTAVLFELQARKIIPLEIVRCRVNAAHWNAQRSTEMVAQLATLLQAGLSLSEGLTLLAEQHPSAQWQALLLALAEELRQGIAFSEALKQWPAVFPPLFVSMIRTGELTGKLDVCCLHLAMQQNAQHQLAMKVKKALRYPLIVLTVALLVVMAMLWFVLPEFAAIYQTFNTPLPALTRGVMAAANLLHQGLLPLLVCLSITLCMAKRYHHHARWQRLRQTLLLRVPVAGALVRGQKLSQIFTVLSLTQNAGIAFLQGLESVEETLENGWWREIIQDARLAITHGSPIWQALEKTTAFTPLCLQLIRTGEASGSLDSMLDNLSRYHREKTEQRAEDLATLLEPVMLLVTGIIIGTLVVAMYLPVFHLGDAISGMG